MEILVQKFGGSSLQSPDSRVHVLQHIQKAVQENKKVIAVVSAIGRHPNPYATDSLLELINYPNTSALKKEIDLLLSTGETISSVVLSHELKENGMKSIAFTGQQAGILTNKNHLNAKITSIDPVSIYETFKNYDVIVVAGFQGATEDGAVATLGRGGSDTSAIALAAATKAIRAEIFTDVPGIMTADPKIVKNASTLKNCTYVETCNLAYQGAKIIHPHAVEIAMQANIPLSIRSTYLKDPGTTISKKRTILSSHQVEPPLITGIAHRLEITQVKISKKNNPNLDLSMIFKTIAQANISLDCITFSPHEVTFTLLNKLQKKAEEILTNHHIEAELIPQCAKVSVVGAAMTGMPGVAAKVVSILAKKDIQILQAGDSDTTIWALIPESKLYQAVNALHETFQLSKQSILQV